MPGKTAKVTITERQHDILRTIQNAPTASSQLRQRAAVILLAFDGLRNEDIDGTEQDVPARCLASSGRTGLAGPF
jgi:hypothetical protein